MVNTITENATSLEEALAGANVPKRGRAIPKYLSDQRLRNEVLGEMKRRSLTIAKVSTDSGVSVATIKDFLLTGDIRNKQKQTLVGWLSGSVEEQGIETGTTATAARPVIPAIAKATPEMLAAVAEAVQSQESGGEGTLAIEETIVPVRPFAPEREADVHEDERLIVIPRGTTELKIVLRFE